MLVLSWNCRGLRNASTVNTLRSFLRATKAHIVFLSETKCDLQYSVSTLNRLGYDKFVVVPAQGLSGGLWLFWDSDLDLSIISVSKNLIRVKIGGSISDPSWELLCYYGPPSHSDRNEFWSDMTAVTTAITVPFLCVGDFNSITCQAEKRGGNVFVSNLAHAFNSWVANTGLIDLGYVGPAFTWENRKEPGQNIAERLDRALGSGPWCLQYPNAGVMHLPRYSSDHNPILLKTAMLSHRHKSIPRFEAFWLQNPSFMEVLSDSWHQRASISALPSRLKRVLRDLKKWGSLTYGSLTRQIKKDEDRLLVLQSGPLSKENQCEERVIQQRLTDFLNLEEIFWQQRARINWLNAGDKNTTFFHLSAQNRKRKNTISSLMLPNGRWTHNPEQISSTLVNHFHAASQSTTTTPIPTEILETLPKITTRENELLYEIPTKEEIVFAIQKIGSGKAPGPDGLPALFYQKCWDVVGDEVISLVQNFFNTAVLPISLNHTHLALLAKKKNACCPAEFRPISLCNVLYKLITKIITLRLRPLIDGMISNAQNAFVPGRQITDNLVIALEIFHSMAKAPPSKSAFALKLDMAKAYDRVNWSYLSQVLRGFGLVGKSHDLIMACVTSPTFSILVNGAPQGSFAAARGLRQGCPLSPYLFILCSEILSKVTHQAETSNSFKGYQVNSRAPTISHLLFADDLFFFGQATIENVLGVRNILQKYEAFSGQEVNYSKSSLHVSPKLDTVMKQILLDILGVSIMGKHDKYLGNQLLLSSSRISSFDELIEKCKKKLSSWKASTLSHAGRSILLKSSLASIPVYSMGTTVLPKGVTQKLTQIQRNFWWGGTKDHKKLCYISWDKISKPKQLGGLGVRRIEQVNLSLISKLVWRFLCFPESDWSKLLQAKHMRNSSFWDATIKYNSSALWRDMITCRDLMKNGVCWSIGNGEKIHIWNDPWIPSIPGFRALRSLDSSSQVTRVSELILPNTSQWNISLVTSLFVPHIANAVLQIQLSGNEEDDKLLWLPATTGAFTAKSMYQHLLNDLPASSSTQNHVQNFKWATLWKIKGVAPRIILFIWRALHNGLAVGNVLKKISGGPGYCTQCQDQVETIDHCLFFCPTAADVWIASGILLAQPNTGHYLPRVISDWAEKDMELCRKGCAILWAIWKARNAWVFSAKVSTPELILHTAETLFKDYNSPTEPSLDSLQQSNPIPSNACWTLPPHSWVKINFDGACVNGELAAAAIARGADGAFLGCLAQAKSFGCPIQAEAMGCILAIDLMHRLQLKNVLIEGDSKGLMDYINGPSDCCDWRISPTVKACQRLTSTRTDICFSFAPRDTNKVAHNLATHAITHRVNQFWTGGLPPPFLLDSLFADLNSTVTFAVDE